ncbi:ARPP-2 domain-containing protein [Spirillospora sp. CA-294931]|uniref:ARPP-2 domain-containing protein n=1 Tax=Spirillospora sp. CA-294931 TaxID=3240042 RepID=UPI003D8CE454
MTFQLDGLHTGPAQTWGSIRLVPLLRDEPIRDLRLHRRVYDQAPSVVDVGDGTAYVSFIPHAFVAVWGPDNGAAASYGTRMEAKDDRGVAPPRMPIKIRRRMARRVAKDRLRFLPLHLAVEGYLALHFGGPEIAWEEWSRRAVANGLSPRCEEAYTGDRVRGLEDALRIFEIHPGQCGVLVYVAEALASAFVVPHPDDYRSLHPTLVEDLFGELVYQYGLLGAPTADLDGTIDATRVRSLADLRAEARRRSRDWAGFHDEVMAGLLFDEDGSRQTVQYLKGFELSRFLPAFTPGRENHIGETITGDDGRVAYLKTYRLSEGQIRRGHLLTRLAAHDWRLDDTAAALGVDLPALALRLERAGFAYLLRQDVLDRYRAARRKGLSGGR